MFFNNDFSVLPALAIFSFFFLFRYFEIQVQNEKGEVKKIRNAKSLRGKRLIPVKNLKSGAKVEASDVLYNLHDVFSEPGNYTIYIIFKDTMHEDEVKSNLMHIEILEPTGTDADAAAAQPRSAFPRKTTASLRESRRGWQRARPAAAAVRGPSQWLR